MKDFPYKTSFSFIIKPLVSEEKDKFLALASLEQIKKFIPNININSNQDLLPIAFNSFVANRVNKNDDVIDTKTALAIYKNFLYKQINIEHKRSNVVGVILTAGFSKFGTDEPLTEDQVKDIKDPFNVTLGGVIWRVVNGELANFIEDSSDPESENYMAISASWELGFTNYKLISLPEGQKNIANAETVDSKFKEHLRALGGDGIIEGRRIYRMPTEDVTPLGIGLTEKPAADVKGILVNQPDSQSNSNMNNQEIEKSLKEINEILKTSVKKEDVEAAIKSFSKNNISQAEISNVNKERTQNMKPLNSINDITDENLKEVTASAISDLVKQEILKKNEEYVNEKSKIEKELTKASDEYKKLSEENTKLQESLKSVQATVETLQKEKKDKELVEKFNNRMNALSEKFDLDDEARAAIVDEVKAIESDEAFDKYLKKASILYKGFAKKAPESKENKEPNQSVASVVNDAIDNSNKEKNSIPNSTSTASPKLSDLAKLAFGKDSIEVKLR